MMGDTNKLSSRASDTAEDKIVNYLGGYHRCYLDQPVHLEFISENLCRLLGYTKEEIDALIEGKYTCLIHPDDAPRFDAFISGFFGRERCDSILYRLIKKDGMAIGVVDTMASRLCEDGRLRGHSVVCKIPDEAHWSAGKADSDNVSTRHSVLKVSGGREMPIEMMNEAADELLSVRTCNEAHGLMDFVSVNDRAKVRRAIERAYTEERSGEESCVVIRADGRTTRVVFWVERLAPSPTIDDTSFCVFVEDEPSYSIEHESDRDMSRLLLTNLTEDVFELGLTEDSIKRISSSDSGLVNCPINVRMFADDAFDTFLDRVMTDDRQAVSDFIGRTRANELRPDPGNLARIRFGVDVGDGSCQVVVAAVVPVSRSRLFICLDSNTKLARHGNYSSCAIIRRHVTVRMFGSFNVAVDGRTILFRHEKAKELLALLLERRGSFVSSREAIGMLWECVPDDKSRARYRKTASRLMAELKDNGIDYIVESERGSRRVIPEHLTCDYYEYLDGNATPLGSLLPEYSWSEYIRIS